MLSKLLPLVFLIAGTGAGIGAAIFTAPGEPAGAHTGTGAQAPEPDSDAVEEGHSGPDSEFVKLKNQFVVPLVKDEKVTAMMVISLSLEAAPGFTETIYTREPKLRDLFLRVMFDHANMGGFRGAFTQAGTMDLLRGALREVARKELGPDLRDVLITDIARQDS